MKINITRGWFGAWVLIGGVFCQGCASHYNLKLTPVTSYTTVERLDLSVALLLEDQFTGQGDLLLRDVGLRKIQFRAPGSALAESAGAFARSMFREVRVVNSLSAVNSPPTKCSAILKPQIKGEDEAYGAWGGIILFLEWTVTKPNGELVWKKTFRGEGSGGNAPSRHAQKALEETLSASFTNMYKAPTIRALVAVPSRALNATGL